MLGHRIALCLISPPETINGELRKQDASGVWVFCGYAENAKVVFFPIHRVERMEDNGYVHR